MNLSTMKGHDIVTCDTDYLYHDTIYSTCLVDKSGNNNSSLNGIFYADELEERGWEGAADTIRSDVTRGEFGGSFEDKSFFRNVNKENFEVALTTEYQDYPNGKALFIFEAYKVTPLK